MKFKTLSSCNLGNIFGIYYTALCSIFTADVQALRSVWMIGDDFLYRVFPGFQQLKSDCFVKKEDLPYLYQYYYLNAWYVKQIQSTVPSMAKIQNAMAAAFNEFNSLPKYLMILPDKDLIVLVEHYDKGAKQLLMENVCWLIRQIGRALISRHEDLK